MSKRLETVAMRTCMKTLLMFFNCIIGLCGVLILLFSIWMRIEMRDYINVNNNGGTLFAFSSLGAALTLAAMLACCCTMRGHPALLYLYGAFLAVVVLLEFGAGALVYAYRTVVNEEFDKRLNESMAAYGQDPRSTDTAVLFKSEDIDQLQSVVRCCGNHGYTDWLHMYPPKEIPLSCCKVPKCEPSNIDQIYTNGCYDRVLEVLNINIGLVAGMAISVAFFPLIGVFLACCLATSINKSEYEQVA